MIWRQAKALVLARRGEHVEAQQLAQEAASLSATDAAPGRPGRDVLGDLAQVLMLGDRPPLSRQQALQQSLDRYARKENLVMAERVRRTLESLSCMTQRCDEHSGYPVRRFTPTDRAVSTTINSGDERTRTAGPPACKARTLGS